MSGWHREHPELVGTDADPWMANPAHAAAHRETEMHARFPNLDSMIANAEESFGGVMCECGHRFDEHDQDPPGGGYCDLCDCEGHEERDDLCDCEGHEEREDDEEQFTSCGQPGPHGCQRCDACSCWGCDEYHRRRDEGYY